MRLLFKMCEYELLPVSRELIRADGAVEAESAAGLSRFHEEMHLRVVAERLKVSHALDRSCNRLAIGDCSLVKVNGNTIAPRDESLQNLRLHLSHELKAYLPAVLIPEQMECRFLLLERAEFWQHFRAVAAFRQDDAVAQNGREERESGGVLEAEAIPRAEAVQPCYGEYSAGGSFSE